VSDRPIELRHPDVVAPPPLIFFGPLLGGLLLDRLLPLPKPPAAVRLLGVPALAAGAVLISSFFRDMTRAGTPIDPYQAPTALVTEGAFQHTRNPAYLGMALVYSWIALLTRARWPLIFLPGVLVAIDRGVIEREEELLEERFGAAYSDYRARVRRWL